MFVIKEVSERIVEIRRYFEIISFLMTVIHNYKITSKFKSLLIH